jgi:hypothetical protein
VRPDFDSLTDRQRHDQHGKPVAFLRVRSCHRKDIRARPTKIADQPRNKDPEMKTIACLAIFACALTVGGAAQAQDVRIPTFKRGSVYTLNGQTFTVTRDQNRNATFQGELARTSRACPLDCIQPMHIADGITTLGDLELLDFLENRFRDDILRALGAVAQVDGSLDFTNALTRYSGGVWSNDAPNPIRHQMAAGYPANRGLLSSPDRIRVGQHLVIPQLDA